MSKQHPEESSIKEQVMNSLQQSENHKKRAQDSMKESEVTNTRASRTNKSKLATKKVDLKNQNPEKFRRQKEDKLVNRIVLIVVVTLVFVLGISGFSIYRYITSSLEPLDPNNKEVVFVEVPIGSSNKMIGEILEEHQIIKNGTIFNFFTKFNNLSGFQAGRFQFSQSMTLDEISNILKEGGLAADQADARLAIPEGYDIDQIGDVIEKETDFSKAEFLDAMADKKMFNQMKNRYPVLLADAAKAKGVRYPLEGYLFPATYDYFKGMQLDDLVSQMVGKTNEVMTNYLEAIEESQWNLHEVLTLASLVEKEGVEEEDRRNIAQVFFNRLAIDMPLQSDIAILYALGVHKELVTFKDLEVDSPYNLYKHTGFGPGPFNNPGEAAIEAVLNPKENPYYYFVADLETGKVYFAETLEEHNVLVEQYVNK
ncbi:endolytic transglycosylase MltG [Enterococcus sp. LJL98]